MFVIFGTFSYIGTLHLCLNVIKVLHVITYVVFCLYVVYACRDKL